MNNNTVPSGASSSPPAPPKSTPSTTSSSASANQRSQGTRNLTNSQFDHYNIQTQFLIHEEGGLERWFNLTITNVGTESAADYTCVAVNAGGVMEENISLTFDDPKPVSDISTKVSHS